MTVPSTSLNSPQWPRAISPSLLLSSDCYSIFTSMHVCVCLSLYVLYEYTSVIQPVFPVSRWISKSEDELCPSTSAVLPAVFEGCQGVRTGAGPSPAEMHCAKTFPKATVKGRTLKCQRLTLPFSRNNTNYWWKQP